MQISPGTTRFFSSIYLPHLLHLSPCSYGLQLVTQSYPQMQPYMRFLYVRPEVCPRVSRFPESGFLQIPSHDEHPCLRLCPSHYRADSGLAPARNVLRRAHVAKTVPDLPALFHHTAYKINAKPQTGICVRKSSAGIKIRDRLRSGRRHLLRRHRRSFRLRRRNFLRRRSFQSFDGQSASSGRLHKQ